MPAPTSYSESDLAAFMVGELADTAAALGWDSSSLKIIEAVYDVEYACGVADIADATAAMMQQVRALAKREAWKAAMGGAADRYSVSPGGGRRYDEGTLYDHCADQYAQAAAAAAIYGGDGTGAVVVSSITHANDPYAPLNVSGEMG